MLVSFLNFGNAMDGSSVVRIVRFNTCDGKGAFAHDVVRYAMNKGKGAEIGVDYAGKVCRGLVNNGRFSESKFIMERRQENGGKETRLIRLHDILSLILALPGNPRLSRCF